MSGVLQRLVDRASGSATPGLRPRLPARFETAATESWPGELHREMPAQPGPASPAQGQRTDTPPSRNDAPPPPDPLQPRVPLAEVILPSTPPDRPEAPPRGPQQPFATRRTPPEPLMPESPVPRVRSPEAPSSSDPSAVPLHQAAAEADPLGRQPPRVEVVQHYRPAPEPLLPPASDMPRAEPAPPPDGPAAESDTARAEGDLESPAPEITIHIGRLDIGAEPPRPASVPRPASRARPMPSLADYLRGGRS